MSLRNCRSARDGITSHHIRLSWPDNSTNESGFKIERSSGGVFTEIGQVGGSVTTYLDTGLSPNTAYDYRVFGFNSSGNSSASNIGSGRTAAGSGVSQYGADGHAEQSGEQRVVRGRCVDHIHRIGHRYTGRQPDG